MICLLCTACNMSPAFYLGMLIPSNRSQAATQQEALQWVKAQVGKSIDTDGYPAGQPYQCVDLIKAYYSYLGVASVSGNGKDYATNSHLHAEILFLR